MMISSTIAAIATPPGNAGVGIVRLSGPRALEIACTITNHPTTLATRHATLVALNLGKIRDTAIAIYFRAPDSFTGEDVVELQCHGGMLLLEKVLAAAISNGARLAQPGEFSRRALLNGKMSLDTAEALANVIHAESEAELTAASDFLSGEFAKTMREIEKTLVQISAQIEAAIDHPAETLTAFDNEKLIISNEKLLMKIKQFTDKATASKYTYDGIRVAILGRPNVGKSSLFNAILGTSRSIVTDIPGTTTDTVSEMVQIDGYKVRFLDTAGIRETDSTIEKLGIERSIRVAGECDIAIIILDTATPTPADNKIIDLVKSKPHILVTQDYNVEKLKQQIIEKTVGCLPALQTRTIANSRQLSELRLTQDALESAMKSNLPDLIASDIQTALYHIGNVTGTNASEAVLDEIFSRFCLGK